MAGSKLLDTVLVGLMLLASTVTLSIFSYIHFIHQKPVPNDAEELEMLKGDVRRIVDGNAYQLGKLTINLPSSNSRLRFLDVNIYLVPFHEDDIKLFEDHKPVVQDRIIDIAGSIEASELNSISGKILLESRIKKNLNALLGKTAVKKIYFTRFVVQ